MKNLIAKVKKFFARFGKELAAFAALNASFLPVSVLADGGAAGGTDTAPATLVNEIVNIIVDIFMYIGILLLAWSIGMIVLAFKNEDADSKSRGMMLAVVSVILITLKPILGAVLSAAGVTGIGG